MLAAQKLNTSACVSSSRQDLLEPFTAVSFRVAHFIARQKPFLVDFFVPVDETAARYVSLQRIWFLPAVILFML
jgi:hypothetical protein